MKSLYLACWALAAYVALSQGQTTPTPCDFPEICFPPVATFNETADLETGTINARCHSACVDIVLKQLNLTTSMEEIMPTLPCWPSVHLPEHARKFATWCSLACSATFSGHQSTCPLVGCLHLQLFEGKKAFTICNSGCELGMQLRNDSGDPPSSPIAPPVPTSFNPVHFNFANSQPDTNQCATPSTIANTFVVLMSNGTIDAVSMLESSADLAKPFEPFSCKYVNVSFAVVNRYGASNLSPAATMCGGGIVYPSNVRHLIVTLEDDDGMSEQFGQDVLKIKLSWEPPPEAPAAIGYQVTVASTSSESHCPDSEATPVEFFISKNSNNITLESNRSAGFKLPVSCEFHIAVESLPKIPSGLLEDWQQSAEIDVNTEFLGRDDLQFTITSAWIWNEAGFYTLQLNVTLPNVTYVRQGLREIEISVHTSRKSGPLGTFKVTQFLPQDSVPINPSQLTYIHVIPARYPPKEGDQEYVFDIRSQHLTEYYRYRMPKAQKLTFPALSFPPSPVQNVTVLSHVMNGNILKLNVSWASPMVTNGELWRYSVYVWHLPTPDVKQSIAISADNTMHFLSKEIIPGRPQYVMIRAENYFQASNWSTPILLNIGSSPEEQGVPEGVIYGLSVIAALIAVVLVILIVLTLVYYWQRRKDKVVFLKDTETEWYVGGKDNATETLPVDSLPVDEWEISPEQIIMDKQLGSGNFGEVFLGKLIGNIATPGVGPYSTNRCAAVKLLRNEAGPELKMEFLKEISTMKKISMGRCPHVVNMIGCCTLQEPLALVLEYAAYGDLLMYLRTIRQRNLSLKKSKDYEDMKPAPYLTPVSEAEASLSPKARSNDYVEDFHTLKPVPDKTMQDVTCKEEKEDLNPYARLGELEALDLISFAYQIAMGMEYLASIPIVHRDLACRNILVDENKVLKISDFGLARADELYVKNTDGKLPLRWMAVESIMERTFNHKSDVWSYGITLWEICTLGGHPYPSIGNKQLLQHILQGNRLDKPHNCSDEVYSVMLRCWAADPEERPTFAELRITFDIMMSNQRTESYVDLNVDDLLPYYQMKPAEEEEEEEEEEEGSPTLSSPHPSAWLPMDPPDDTVVHITDNTSIDEPVF